MTRPPIDPGRFGTALVLETPQRTDDGLGGHDVAWMPGATIMAQLRPLAASAPFAAGQSLEQVTHQVTLRHRSGLLAGMRFRLGARLFLIVTIHDPDSTRRYLVCRTREDVE